MAVNYLTREKEKELVMKIAKSNNGEGYKAKEELFHMCEFLITAIVSKYANPTISAEHLFKVGKKGLKRALEAYIANKRYEKKFKFSTYSTYFIRKAIKEELIKEKLM